MIFKGVLIIKTMRGNGATAGTFVDSLQLKEILGCVAGDDTLLIVVNSNENALIVTVSFFPLRYRRRCQGKHIYTF